MQFEVFVKYPMKKTMAYDERTTIRPIIA